MCEDYKCDCDQDCDCDEEYYSMPLIGDEMPPFEVQTTHGMMVIPDAFEGKWFVLFSHPGDFTPVCTTEFVAFQKLKAEFDELNCELIGLSIDQVFAHMKWTEWIHEKFGVEITFPIIADDGTVAEELGLIHPGKGSNTVRAVFIVDPEGIIRAILYYPQELGRNMAEIIRMVRGLQIADNNKVAMPADWPNNGIVKGHVIVPPPKSEKERKERLDNKNHECFDWWFCHRKL